MTPCTPPRLINPAKERMKAGGVALGMLVRMARSADIARIAKANGIFAGCGGNRDVGRQVRAIQRGAQFVTTQADIGFLAAAANQWTAGLRSALAAKA